MDGYSLRLRLDRLTVLGASAGPANAEVTLLKPFFNRTPPNGSTGTSRPSGHAATAFAAMAFFSDALRGMFRPEEGPEPVLLAS